MNLTAREMRDALLGIELPVREDEARRNVVLP